MAQDRALRGFGQAHSRENAHAFRRMLLGRRMRVVGIPLVVEVVQQPDQSPCLGILTLPLGHRPHRDLDGVHVLAEAEAYS